MRLPEILETAKSRGFVVFNAISSINLIVQRGPGKPDDWDGLLNLVWRSTVGWHTLTLECATRPGSHYLKHPINPRGTATILGNQQYRRAYKVGTHKGNDALVQIGVVKVVRDKIIDSVYEPTDPDSGIFAVNIHRVGNPKFLAGCIGVHPESIDTLVDTVEELCKIQGDVFSLTVLED